MTARSWNWAVAGLLAFAPTEGGALERSCASDRDCPGDELCVEGMCDAPTGEAASTCASDRDCPGDRICTDGTCHAPFAPRASECADEDCEDDRGSNDEPEPWAGESCYSNSNCADGFVCREFVCIEKERATRRSPFEEPRDPGELRFFFALDFGKSGGQLDGMDWESDRWGSYDFALATPGIRYVYGAGNESMVRLSTAAGITFSDDDSRLGLMIEPVSLGFRIPLTRGGTNVDLEPGLTPIHLSVGYTRTGEHSFASSDLNLSLVARAGGMVFGANLATLRLLWSPESGDSPQVWGGQVFFGPTF